MGALDDGQFEQQVKSRTNSLLLTLSVVSLAVSYPLSKWASSPWKEVGTGFAVASCILAIVCLLQILFWCISEQKVLGTLAEDTSQKAESFSEESKELRRLAKSKNSGEVVYTSGIAFLVIVLLAFNYLPSPWDNIAGISAIIPAVILAVIYVTITRKQANARHHRSIHGNRASSNSISRR